MKKITLSVATLLIAMMSYGQTQCKGMTKMKVQCKNMTKKVNSLCHNHDKNHVVKQDKVAVICSGTTKANKLIVMVMSIKIGLKQRIKQMNGYTIYGKMKMIFKM